VPLKKPSDFFQKTNSDQTVSSSVVEVEQESVETIEVVEEESSTVEVLSQQVEQLQKQLSERVDKEELDRVVLSQLAYVNKSISDIKKNLNIKENKKVKSGLQKPSEYFGEELKYEDLSRIEVEADNFTGIFDVIDNYRKSFIQFDQRLSGINELNEQVVSLRTELERYISKEDVDNTIQEIRDSIIDVEYEIKAFNEERLEEIKQDTEGLVYRVEKFLDSIPKHQQSLFEFQLKIEDKIDESLNQSISDIREDLEKKIELSDEKNVELEGIKKLVEKKIKSISNPKDFAKTTELDEVKQNLIDRIVDIETDVTISETKLNKEFKKLGKIQESFKKTIESLKETDVSDKVEELNQKIESLERSFSQKLEEGLLNITPTEKNTDPLTPLDQKFATFEDLEKHYKLLLSRIQQQLSTIGGGGAVNIMDMDDVAASSIQDGEFLRWNEALGKFVGVAITFTSGSGGSIVPDPIEDPVGGGTGGGTGGTGGSGTITSDVRTESTFTTTSGQVSIAVTYNAGLVDVFSNGVKLTPSEYTAIDGNTITVAEPFLGGETIDVISYSQSSAITRNEYSYVSTVHQSYFFVVYDPRFVDVFVNGVRLTPSEYTATDGQTIILTEPCNIGDIVDIVTFGNITTGGMTNTPSSSTAAGSPGQISYDSNYFYVCVGPNNWKRTSLSAW